MCVYNQMCTKYCDLKYTKRFETVINVQSVIKIQIYQKPPKTKGN